MHTVTKALIGLFLVVSAVIAISDCGKQEPPEEKRARLIAERGRLAGELRDLALLPPTPLPATLIVRNAESRRLLTRLRVVKVELGEDVSGIDAVLRDLDELDRLARLKILE
jgi:hypothetical protein